MKSYLVKLFYRFVDVNETIIRITDEHVKNNQDVRSLLGKSGIKPELLPAEEDIKKLERRVKSADKEIAKKKLKGKND